MLKNTNKKACGFFRRFAGTFFIFILNFSSLLFCDCSQENARIQKEFGADADYFAGLQLLSEKKENEARQKFIRCSKKGTSYCARKSLESLTTFGGIDKKIAAAENLLENFNDKDSRLLAVKLFYENDEFNKIIEITENCDFLDEYNETIKLRLLSLQKRYDSRYKAETFKWFLTKPISTTHWQFYRDFYQKMPENDSEDFESQLSPEDFTINFRIDLYRRNYTSTSKNIEKLFTLINEKKIEFSTQLASDVGKALLYGDSNYSKNALKLLEFLPEFSKTQVEFYIYFYAARLFEQNELYFSKAKECYENAINSTEDESKKDNALWYLMKAEMNFSLENFMENIEFYCQKIHDASYFDDLFDSLSLLLLGSARWDDFRNVSEIAGSYITKDMNARFSYIYARLLQENITGKEFDKETKRQKSREFLQNALNGETDTYYKILAAINLGFSKQEILELLLKQNRNSKNESENSLLQNEVDNYFKGCAYFGFPEKIYSEWQNIPKNFINSETGFYIAEFLKKCAETNDEYYVQSLRIASETASNSKNSLTKEQFALLYPKNFNELIENFSHKYNIDSNVIYALVRSESFFDPDISSVAGAVGLTQLMEFTAGDIARKLRVSNYDLSDPATNLEFGCYYLSELISRCENSYLQAFFAYNAGITRVRRWLNGSLSEFGRKKDLSGDLFLETVPYEETREYGRKLVSASLVYEMLYSEDENSFFELAEKLIYE